MTKPKKYYYDVSDDLAKGCWLNMIVGGRNTGKTYSTLKYAASHGMLFAFIKRTNDDVETLCRSSSTGGTVFDFSPFNALNRDMGWSIHPKLISKGIGGFWAFNENGEPEGLPIGYILSMNNLRDIKGFEFHKLIDIIIFDEFIPQPWERVNRKEGQQVMDLYKTLERDRTHKGLPVLPMVMLANAVRLSNPIFNFFEVTDDFAQMQATKQEYYYPADRQILLHLLKASDDFLEKERSSPVYAAMKNTDWGSMAYGNSFGYDDLSSVGRISLKGCRPVVGIQYRSTTFYVYMKDGEYQITKRRNDKCKVYNLNRENEQKAFFRDHIFDLREACIDDKVVFETYSMYDLIINYKNIFKV